FITVTRILTIRYLCHSTMNFRKATPMTEIQQDKDDLKSTRGFTIQVVFGSWAKPTIQFGDVIKFRICLGFMAVDVIGMDMENFMVNVMKERKYYVRRIEELSS